ncbi:MAG: desulfoferrodoxin [Lentisphaerae bacterium]|nr:desulfoferrodoxin [Lentisphaerota bacterium]
MKNRVREIYKCSKCNLAVEIASACACTEPCMRCCGEVLQSVTPNTVDADKEKHVPHAVRTADGINVQIGSAEHPMFEAHHIVWIEIVHGDWSLRKYLHPGEKPAVEFKLCCCKTEKVKVRTFCNIHGLWECEI